MRHNLRYHCCKHQTCAECVDTTLCIDKTMTLDAYADDADYLWQDGATGRAKKGNTG